MPIETFANPARGRDREGQVDQFMEDVLSEGPRSVADWPRVVAQPIRRGDMFIVEAAPPGFTTMLRFCPHHPDRGDYEIRRRPHGPVEKGRTVSVKEVAANQAAYWLSMLTPFPLRYAIRTVADGRPRTVLMWLVGLHSCRSVDETEDTENGDE